MNFQKIIEGKIFKNKSTDVDNFKKICFICVNEFKWSYQDTMEAPCPFVLDMIDQWVDVKQKEIKAAKKKR